MLEVLSLSELMTTEAKGSGEKPNETLNVDLSVKEKDICGQLGLTEEDFVKYNS